MGAKTHNMQIGKFVLLLIAAALCTQALTNDEADLAEMGGEDESAGNRAMPGQPGKKPPPGQCHKDTFVRATPPILGNTSAYTSYGCKTCSLPHGHKPYEQCTSCGTTKIGNDEHDLYLVAKKFKVHEGKYVPEGSCELLPKLGEFKPSSKSLCQDTSCTDGSTGTPIGGGVNGKPYGSTDKTVCSRLCLLGGALTRVIGLERYEKGTGNRQVDAKFWGPDMLGKTRGTRPDKVSEPVCGLHKTVMCTKNKDYDLVNCEKSGKSTHCKKENCTVKKKVHCVAIFPKFVTHTTLHAQSSHENPLFTVTNGQAYTNDYTNECKYAINPCDLVALYV